MMKSNMNKIEPDDVNDGPVVSEGGRSPSISPGAGRRYGVARVCQVWDLPRSSFYAARQPQADTAAPAAPARRRGPKPAVSDEALLAAIRADLARSPWTGEGHRKVWARLRVIDGIRVARKRVLRVMGEHSLLSPHRARTRTEAPHDRKIITTAPNLMWATDATQIATRGKCLMLRRGQNLGRGGEGGAHLLRTVGRQV
jgi:putative transposase